MGRRHPSPTPVRPSRARAVSWAAALSISAAPLLRQRFRLRVPSFLQRSGVHALSALWPTRRMRRTLHIERSTDSSASRVQGHAAATSPAPAAVAAAAPTHTAASNAVVAALVLQACVAAANRRSMLLGKAATHTLGQAQRAFGARRAGCQWHRQAVIVPAACARRKPAFADRK